MVSMVANAQVRRNTKNLTPVTKLIPTAVTGFENNTQASTAAHNPYLPVKSGSFRGVAELATGQPCMTFKPTLRAKAVSPTTAKAISLRLGHKVTSHRAILTVVQATITAMVQQASG